MTALWGLSLRMKNAAIVDLFWGFGFVIIAWLTWAQLDHTTARGGLLVALVTIWGLRLTAYLTWRNAGKPEDFRYQAMREKHGDRFPRVSLVTVFLFQGVLMWWVSLPIQVGQLTASGTLSALDVIGGSVWAVGVFFESVGDWQLARFKADPANRGKVMDAGLWRYTRHPNYFGDFCVWWGLLLVACGSPWGWATVGSPLLMSFLLLKVSGVAMLEKDIAERRPGYRAYIEKTSAFFPRPPKA
ncbi:MAG: DUF1295 domain-containing protein [Bradymonadia bacterium]